VLLVPQVQLALQVSQGQQAPQVRRELASQVLQVPQVTLVLQVLVLLVQQVQLVLLAQV
jgi:hypothetical protein